MKFSFVFQFEFCNLLERLKGSPMDDGNKCSTGGTSKIFKQNQILKNKQKNQKEKLKNIFCTNEEENGVRLVRGMIPVAGQNHCQRVSSNLVNNENVTTPAGNHVDVRKAGPDSPRPGLLIAASTHLKIN